MENLTFGNIAVATVIVAFLDLVIVVLVRTETILKAIERIKGVIRLDYKNRAKRSDDEIRISKKHELVAKERVRSAFIAMTLWDCKWTWNWSKDFEPINIKGFCLGKEVRATKLDCNYPVKPFYVVSPEDKTTALINESNFKTLVLRCSNNTNKLHTLNKAEFEMPTKSNGSADIAFNELISNSILSERDLRITKEMKKINWQFWK